FARHGAGMESAGASGVLSRRFASCGNLQKKGRGRPRLYWAAAEILTSVTAKGRRIYKGLALAVTFCGASYPPITVSFNVSPTAPPSVINFVSVSGGGDSDVGEGSSHPTNIIQLHDLSLRLTNVSILAVGAVGAIQSWTVSNVGPTPTVGLVTFTNS